MQFTVVRGYCGSYAVDQFVYLATSCFHRRSENNITVSLPFQYHIVRHYPIRKPAKAPIRGSHNELAGDTQDWYQRKTNNALYQIYCI